MKLDRKDLGGTFDYRVASESITGKQLDFYYDLESGDSWFVFRIKGKDCPRIAKTLDEAIALWNA